MGRYEAIHMGKYVEKTWELYARHTPNTCIDIADWGVFVGIDSIKRAWNQGTIGVVGTINAEGSGGMQPPQAGQGSPPGNGLYRYSLSKIIMIRYASTFERYQEFYTADRFGQGAIPVNIRPA